MNTFGHYAFITGHQIRLCDGLYTLLQLFEVYFDTIDLSKH